MKYIKVILLLAFALVALVAAQTVRQPATNPGGTTPAPNTTVNPTPQSSMIRILTPVAGQSVAANFVDVRYEIVNPVGAPGTPNFLVQLDGGDAVHTTSTSYTFTGLQPGAHTVTVTLVDANDTPVNGGRAAVQFAVPAPTGANQGPGAANAPALPNVEEQRAGLPSGASSLPLISLIGFGVLIGGVASALKTRH